MRPGFEAKCDKAAGIGDCAPSLAAFEPISTELIVSRGKTGVFGSLVVWFVGDGSVLQGYATDGFIFKNICGEEMASQAGKLREGRVAMMRWVSSETVMTCRRGPRFWRCL